MEASFLLFFSTPFALLTLSELRRGIPQLSVWIKSIWRHNFFEVKSSTVSLSIVKKVSTFRHLLACVFACGLVFNVKAIFCCTTPCGKRRFWTRAYNFAYSWLLKRVQTSTALSLTYFYFIFFFFFSSTYSLSSPPSSPFTSTSPSPSSSFLHPLLHFLMPSFF